jgi:hypothetical protein
MKTRVAFFLLLLPIAGCSEARQALTKLDPFEVDIPIDQGCKPDLVIADYRNRVFADNSAAMLSATDIDAQTKLLLAGRDQRDADRIDLLAALTGCMRGGAK